MRNIVLVLLVPIYYNYLSMSVPRESTSFFLATKWNFLCGYSTV